MSESIDNLISTLAKDQVKLGTELTRRWQESESINQALVVKIELLRNAIDTALHGTSFDDFGNRDDDGLLPHRRTVTAVMVLQEALNLTKS
jgi:hypothetical protein